MKLNALIVGGYYIWEEKSLILHFCSARTDGMARYDAYNLPAGKYKFTSTCELGNLMQWADRKATVEEMGRLEREYPPQVDTQSTDLFERRSRPLREVLRRTRPDRW